MHISGSARRWMRAALSAAAVVTLAFAAAPSRAHGAPKTPPRVLKMAVGVCGVCHGVTGNSINPMFPRLAGQHADYLEHELKAFRAHTRADPYAVAYMWGIAGGLSNASIDALAKYFAAQAAGPGLPHAAAWVARGNAIYHDGIPAQGVPACAACHGPQGLGSAAFPRLAGQHAEYLLKQLQSFHSKMRKTPIMDGIASSLHRREMRAVADYLASLP
jgi:cytochrome c553